MYISTSICINYLYEIDRKCAAGYMYCSVTCDPADFVPCEKSCDAGNMSPQTVAQKVKFLPWILQLTLSPTKERSSTFSHRGHTLQMVYVSVIIYLYRICCKNLHCLHLQNQKTGICASTLSENLRSYHSLYAYHMYF